MATYQTGSTGDDVIEIQHALVALGFDPGPADGKFGNKTHNAVRDYQRANGLVDDGIVGDKTVAALLDALDKAHAAIPTTDTPRSAFNADGFYEEAIRFDIHPGRIGGHINPRGAVIHDTDMLPATFAPLLNAWRAKQGLGNGATFLIGREPNSAAEGATPNGGVVQMVSILRNANHAGGQPEHGWVQAPNGAKIHPNTAYVGIELHAAGRLVKHPGSTKYEHKATGTLFNAEDIYTDERGAPWHKVTDYQFEQLEKLLGALDAYCPHFPEGTKILSHGNHALCGVRWAAPTSTRFPTHVGLDPARKLDPGAQVVSWLNARYSGTR